MCTCSYHRWSVLRTAVLPWSCWRCASHCYPIQMAHTWAGVSPASYGTAHGCGLERLKSFSWWSSEFGRLALMWCRRGCSSWVCCWDGLQGILLMWQLLTSGCKVYTLPSSLSFIFFMKVMASHLDGLNSINQSCSHLWRLSRSAWSVLVSCMSRISWYTRQSVNIRTMDLTLLSRSLM